VDNDRSEANRPKFSASTDLTWTKGPLTLNYGINWHSKTRRFATEITDQDPDRVEARYLWLKEFWDHQVQVAYNVDRRMTIYAGVNNLLDTKGSVGLAGFPNSATGRFLYVGVRLKPF
jgi:outer membrane receptor protein involved in Fe transport